MQKSISFFCLNLKFEYKMIVVCKGIMQNTMHSIEIK